MVRGSADANALSDGNRRVIFLWWRGEGEWVPSVVCAEFPFFLEPAFLTFLTLPCCCKVLGLASVLGSLLVEAAAALSELREMRSFPQACV
jgi:hypothetical protein